MKPLYIYHKRFLVVVLVFLVFGLPLTNAHANGGEGITVRQCILLSMLGAPLPPECLELLGRPPYPADPTDEDALRELEDRHTQYLLDRDFDALAQVLHPDFSVNDPLNVVIAPRAAVLDFYMQEQFPVLFEKHLEAIHVLGDMAVTLGADLIVQSSGAPSAGIEQHRRFTGFWERLDDDWRMVGRQETVIAREVTEYGEALEMGDGTIRLFLTFDPTTRKPAAFGVQWDASWDSLPPDPAPLPPDGPGEWSWVAEMPEMANELLPIDHVSFDWNPHGHPPPGIYDVPHVDVHFYLISREVRQEITPGSCPGVPFPVNCETLERATAPLPPEAQPPRHTLQESVIPFMGLHLLDPESDELQGLPFTNTFIFGQFDQRIIFLEPMITTEHFEGLTESDCRPIANPERFAEAGWYPTTYCVHNNDGFLSVTLEDFQWYEAVEPDDP